MTAIITIDGPAASGKGTIAERVAEALSFHYLDSGALYRIATLAAIRTGVDFEDHAALGKCAASIRPVFMNGRILLAGVDVTDAIRTDEVSALTSRMAAVPGVRKALFELQRAFVVEPGLVADGRDMGTVVFPEARLKIFMTADVEVRARRRYEQQAARGADVVYEKILEDLKVRDKRDRERATAPLKPAEGAKILDTSLLSIEEVVEKVLGFWRQASAI